jgi:hypothetical protein
MEPQVWGKHGWFFLHSVTMGYPQHPTNTDRDKYRSFFYNIGSILPCNKCQINYRKHMEQIPIEPALINRDKLVEWLINIHNLTNRDTGKKELSYAEVVKIYTQAYGHSRPQTTYHNYECNNNKKGDTHTSNMTDISSTTYKIIIGALLLAIVLLLWKMYSYQR